VQPANLAGKDWANFLGTERDDEIDRPGVDLINGLPRGQLAGSGAENSSPVERACPVRRRLRSSE
jgi:hypothetical protein